MKQRKTVSYDSAQYISTMPMLLVELIPWLEKELAAVPQPYRESAELEILHDCDGDDVIICNISISYLRPETEPERELRESNEARVAAGNRTYELEHLAKLKAKYE